MPLSVAGLVILVSALASGITFALVNNSNNAKASNSTIVTTTPVLTTVITSSPIETTTIVPTTDPYAGWKDYKNMDYSYSVKYPSNMSVVDKCHIGSPVSNSNFLNSKQVFVGKVLESDYFQGCRSSDASGTMFINVANSFKDPQNSTDNTKETVNLTNLNINGNPASLYTFNGLETKPDLGVLLKGQVLKEYVIKKGNLYYILSLNDHSSLSPTPYSVLDQIVQSFKLE